MLGELHFALPASYPISDTLNVAACEKCGFVKSLTRSSQLDYNDYYQMSTYSPSYKTNTHSVNEQEYWKETLRIASVGKNMDELTICDIGTGLSPFPAICHRQGVREVIAVDLSEDCVTIQNNQDGVIALKGSVEVLHDLKNAPKVVSLIHILEHLVDIESTLATIHSALPTDSRLYVEVPDTLSLELLSKGKPLSHLYYTHLNHFDTFHLICLFERHGFRVITSGMRMRPEQGLDTPSIYALFEKTDTQKKSESFDFTLAETVKKWFENTTLDPDGTFNELCETGRKVYVWGAGMHAHLMLGMSPLRECNIRAVVDKNEHLIGRKLGTWTIESSDLLHQANEKDCVVITTLLHTEKMKQILAEEYGFHGAVITL